MHRCSTHLAWPPDYPQRGLAAVMRAVSTRAIPDPPKVCISTFLLSRLPGPGSAANQAHMSGEALVGEKAKGTYCWQFCRWGLTMASIEPRGPHLILINFPMVE